MSSERQSDSSYCGDLFPFTIETIPEHSSADSLAFLSQVPYPDFKLILDSFNSDEPGCNSIPEGDKRCRSYVRSV